MSKSNIVDNFLKIAQEKALSFKETAEKTKKELEKNPRADSLSIEDIAKLYNVKPDLPKGSQYKRNIYEVAHPSPVVISPSYDKLNGLVENENERQDISLNILMGKEPNGHLTQHKYAEKDLILSLVRVGNDLDNHNQDKLRALADTCLFQVSTKSIYKKGVAPLVVAGVLSGLIGVLWLQQHMSFINEGFEKNHEKLMDELNDLINSHTMIGFGYDYTPQFQSMLQDFNNKLSNFYNIYLQNKSIILEMEKPKTAKEALEISKKSQTNNAIKAFENINNLFNDLLPYLQRIQLNFSNEYFKNLQIEDKGVLQSLIDKTHVLHGGKGLVADDFDDVKRAIPPYIESVQQMLKYIQQASSIEDAVRQQIQDATSKIEDNKQSPTKSDPTSKTKPTSTEHTDIDDELEQLEKTLNTGL